jgi:hypothetical protein
VVRQRLKRQAISPKLRALYGKGEMNLDQLYAFAIAEDHKRQERLWKITALQPQPRGAALAHYFFASRIASPIDFAESVTVSFDSERSRLRHGSDIGLKPTPLSYSFNR